MEEKHSYISKITFGSVRYDLSKVYSSLTSYLSDNATLVPLSTNHSTTNSVISSSDVFHKDGISISMCYWYEKENPSFGDLNIVLFSDKTPTENLELTLENIASKYLDPRFKEDEKETLSNHFFSKGIFKNILN